jgi:hypothetical protein
MTPRRDIAVKGTEALKRTAGVGGRLGRVSKPPEGTTMPDTLMTKSFEGHHAEAHNPRFIHVDWNADPVALELVTSQQLAAMRRHIAAVKTGNPKGAADVGALHALATLNGWPLNPPT